MLTILQTQIRKVLLCNAHAPSKTTCCNCRIKDQYPVQGACQEHVVYKVTIKVDGKVKVYIDSTNNFKARYSGHKNSLKVKIIRTQQPY